MLTMSLSLYVLCLGEAPSSLSGSHLVLFSHGGGGAHRASTVGFHLCRSVYRREGAPVDWATQLTELPWEG